MRRTATEERRRPAQSGDAAWLIVLVALVLPLLSGCRQPAPTVALDVRVPADGGLALTVDGPPEHHVLVIAGPPWRGHETLPAGRLSADIKAADRQAGAGVQLEGMLNGATLRGEVAATTVAALPRPLIFQAICSRRLDTGITATLSNAFVLGDDDGRPSVRPYTIGFGLARIGGKLVVAVFGLAVIAWLLRRSPAPRLPLALLPLAAASLLGLRACSTAGPSLLPQRGYAAEVEQLDQFFSGEVGRVVTTVRDARIGDEPVVFVLDAEPARRHAMMVAHWRRLVPGATTATAGEAPTPSGLIVRVSSVPRRDEVLAMGDQVLVQTADAAVLRRGGKR